MIDAAEESSYFFERCLKTSISGARVRPASNIQEPRSTQTYFIELIIDDYVGVYLVERCACCALRRVLGSWYAEESSFWWTLHSNAQS